LRGKLVDLCFELRGQGDFHPAIVGGSPNQNNQHSKFNNQQSRLPPW
jgi:hypothetical protein